MLATDRSPLLKSLTPKKGPRLEPLVLCSDSFSIMFLSYYFLQVNNWSLKVHVIDARMVAIPVVSYQVLFSGHLRKAILLLLSCIHKVGKSSI